MSRLAFAENVFFRITHDRTGKLIGIFITPDKLERISLPETILGVPGLFRSFEYRQSDQSNVISYTWKRHIGEGGSGSNTRILIINGQPVFQRFDAQTETIKSWRLKPDKIRTELAKKDSLADKTTLMKQWIDVSDFEEIKHFFEAVDSSTAPEGFGYTINLETMGDPMLTVGLRIRFGGGFPDRLNQVKVGALGTTFYLRKVTHSIDRSGYKCAVEVADVFTITGGGFVI